MGLINDIIQWTVNLNRVNASDNTGEWMAGLQPHEDAVSCTSKLLQS
jgi:hypothetical protein